MTCKPAFCSQRGCFICTARVTFTMSHHIVLFLVKNEQHSATDVNEFFLRAFPTVVNRAVGRRQPGLSVNPERESQQDQDPQQRDPEPAGGEGSPGNISFITFYFYFVLLSLLIRNDMSCFLVSKLLSNCKSFLRNCF